MNVFTEDQHWYAKNRRFAEEAECGKAILATGEPGINLRIASMPIILTRDEALHIANLLANQIAKTPVTNTSR